jgi:hypothetical protein
MQLLRISFLLLLFIQVSTTVSGQNSRFYLRTDRPEVVAGTTFMLEAVLENMDADRIVLSDIQPFEVVQGPSTASSISIINGKKTESLTYTWLVQAPAKGVYTLAPATVRIGSRTLSSNTVRMIVTEKVAESSGKEDGQPLFVRLESNFKNAVPGQQIVIDLVLYTAVEVAMYQVLNNIEARGLFIKMAEKTDFPTQYVTLGGKNYYSKVLRRHFVFPQKTGVFNISAQQVAAEVVSGPGRAFSFFSETYQKELLSNSLELRITDLPDGAPAEFSGAVGEYTVTFSAANHSVSKGGTALLKLYIEGDGDPKKIKNPVIQVPEGLEGYDPIIRRDEWIEQGGRMRMYRELEYNFVPVTDTVFTFVPAFSFYSTVLNRYEKISGDTITWKVLPADNLLTDKQKVLENSEYDDSSIFSWHQLSSFSGMFLKYVLPVLLFLLVLYVVRKQKNKYTGMTSDENTEVKRLHDKAKIHLDAARVYQKTGSMDACLRELDMAVHSKLQDHVAENIGVRSRAEICELLAGQGFSQDIINQYMQIGRTIDQLRFGGAPTVSAGVLEEVSHFLVSLEEHKR